MKPFLDFTLSATVCWTEPESGFSKETWSYCWMILRSYSPPSSHLYQGYSTESMTRYIAWWQLTLSFFSRNTNRINPTTKLFRLFVRLGICLGKWCFIEEIDPNKENYKSQITRKLAYCWCIVMGCYWLNYRNELTCMYDCRFLQFAKNDNLICHWH